MHKGQVALEFMSFVMIGLVIALILLVSIMYIMQDSQQERYESETKDFGFKLQRELILASEVHEGYVRDIYIGDYIGKKDFTITNTERVLIISVDDIDYPFPIPVTNGTFQKGNNTIKNIAGVVVIE